MTRGFLGGDAAPGIVFGRYLPQLFFNPDTGSNNGGSSASSSGGTSGTGNDPAQAFQNLLARSNNDAMALATRLFDENYQYRTQLREVQGQLPAQGSVVLSAEQATQWQAYQQLGTVEALTSERTTAQAAQTELAGLKYDQHIHTVAEIGDGSVKYKPSVLKQLPGADKLTFEIRGEGDKRSVVVKDGDKETPLADYAKTTWADFLPALQAGQAAPQPAGTPFIPQHSGTQQGSGSGGAGNSIEEFAKQFQAARDSQPNPFAPVQAPKI